MELRPLACRLRGTAPVYGIRASGFEPGEPICDRVEQMAHAYVAAIRAARPRGPYRIAGYSLGGLVAHEMAQRLAAGGERVSLVLLDTTTHDRYWPADAWLEYLGRRALHHFRRLRGRRVSTGELKWLARAFVGRVRAAVAGAPPADELGGVELPPFVQRLRRAGLLAFARHRPAAGEVPIMLLRSDLGGSLLCDPLRVWRRLAPTVVVRDVPGDHRSMIRLPHVDALAAALSDCLEQADAEACLPNVVTRS